MSHGPEIDVKAGELPGTLLLQPRIFRDERGSFSEIWHETRYAGADIPKHFVQDNISNSTRGVLRGLHFQHPYGQGKLVTVLEGEIFDVAVDLRQGSPSFARWSGVRLSAAQRNQFWIPPGFAHGFCVLAESALVLYKCTETYRPDCEISLRWDDPAIGIDWPIKEAIVSKKDREGFLLADIPREQLPQFHSR